MKKLLIGILSTLMVLSCATACELPSLGDLTSPASSESITESTNESVADSESDVASSEESDAASSEESVADSENSDENVETETYTLTLKNGNPMMGGTAETYEYVAGATLELPTLEAEGKNFLGWFDIEGNAAPATMPAESTAFFANWEITTYTLTIVNGEETTEITFGVEYGNNIMATVADLPYVLEDNLPEGYVWVETVPETFALQNYTFTAVELFTLTLKNGNPMAGGTAETYEYVAGATLELPTLEAEGKNFLGWFDIEGNAAPATMPAESTAFFANWEVIPYTLTIVNGEKTTEITFGVEYTMTGIDVTVADLAYVLADNLPADTIETIYSWKEALPETFALQNYTFTVVATEAPKYNVTLRNGSPMMGGTTEILSFYAGETVEIPELSDVEGKKFLGWYGMDENGDLTVAAPATMPAKDLAFFATWEIIPYTLTIKQDGAEDKVFTFAVEYTNDIMIAVTDLAYVLEDNLPASTDTVIYEYAEAIPESFTLQNYTFTVNSITTLSIPEAVALGESKAHDKYTTEEYLVSGVVVNVANTTYGNLTIADDAGNTLYVYGTYNDGSRYDKLEKKPVVGDAIQYRSIVGQYNGTAQLRDAEIVSFNTPETVADIYKVVAESFLVSTNNTITAAGDVTVATAGKTYADVAIAWTSSNTAIAAINGNTITYTLPAESTEITLTATLSLGEVSKQVALTIKVSAAPVAGEKTVSLDFSTITGDTQYVDASYTISEDLTVSTHNKGCHINTQLRIYDSSSNNGWAILTCSGVVSKLVINVGNKAATLAVYGSTDNSTWEKIEDITTTAAYKDKTVTVDAAKGYKYIKLDAVGAQLRIASLSVTMS